jgi:hypothetical protein
MEMPYRDITLVPTRGANNEISWEIQLSHNGGNGGPGKYPPLKLAKGMENVEIGVKIKQANQMGVKFDDDPIWVERLSSCPSDGSQVPSPTSPGVYQDQIKDVEVFNDSQMTFVDLNKGDPMCLNYRLNFIDTKNGNKEIYLDPIIENGGGGGYVPPAPGTGLLDPGSSAFWMLVAVIFLACLAANLAARMIKLGRG